MGGLCDFIDLTLTPTFVQPIVTWFSIQTPLIAKDSMIQKEFKHLLSNHDLVAVCRENIKKEEQFTCFKDTPPTEGVLNCYLSFLNHILSHVIDQSIAKRCVVY